MPRLRFLADPILFKTHELAERLGRTARELQQTMSVPELVRWIAYDRYRVALMDQAHTQAEMDAKNG